MKIFVNDRPIKVKPIHGDFNKKKFDQILGPKDEIISTILEGHILIHEATLDQISSIFRILEVKKLKRLDSITLAVSNKESVSTFIKDQFKIIKAAGGLVKKDNTFLLIHRLGVWDLPKGKLEKNESSELGAVREVEEECGVRVTIDSKICSTWHTYNQRGKRILKKTDWFLMNCEDDTNMAPQEEEDISEVIWMDEFEVKKAIKTSYASIQDVYKKFKKKLKQKNLEE